MFARLSTFLYRCLYYPLEMLVIFTHGYRVRGRQNVPASGPVLLIGNHQSYLDIPLMGLVQEIPIEEVRMGLRVEAVWADELGPTMSSIKYWKPTGEPDADYETYRHHL